jgi:cell division protein FtsW (lipid II flippase)
VAGIAILALVLVPGVGREVNGATRWIAFGPFNLQPSELMKLFFVVYLAGYMTRRQHEVQNSWQACSSRSGCSAPWSCCCCSNPTSAPRW